MVLPQVYPHPHTFFSPGHSARAAFDACGANHIVLVAWMLLFMMVSGGTARAQGADDVGFVWEPPAGIGAARQQLSAIRQAGANAIRMESIPSPDVVTLADRLGLSLYIDLPVERMPASHLIKAQDYAEALLDSVLALARQHPSIRHVGLARHSDTSDSTACAYFDALVARARPNAPAGMQFYYTSRFIDADTCAASVDFVLLDLLGHPDPVRSLRRWRASGRTTPAGIASLGTWVRRDDRDGLLVPHSAAAQGRYLEASLPVLISDTLSMPLPAVFIYHWQDRERSLPVVHQDLEKPFVERFGLHTLAGEPRQAYRVVEGILTGRQDVFAFEEGRVRSGDAPWTTLLGWGVVLMIGIFYASSPRFRHMIPRYFQAHFFFRESVREGRDVLFGSSTVLLTALGIVTGLMLSVSLSILQREYVFSLLFGWIPESTQTAAAAIMASPLVFALLVVCGYIILLMVWTILLALITTLAFPMTPAQVLMLVVWSRWPMLLLLPVSMVLGVTPGAGVGAVALLLGAWLLAELYATGRTLYDLVSVSRTRAHFAVLGFVLHPVIVVGAALLVLAIANEPEVGFAWHALTRS